MKSLKLTILAMAIVTVGLVAVWESRAEAQSPPNRRLRRL